MLFCLTSEILNSHLIASFQLIELQGYLNKFFQCVVNKMHCFVEFCKKVISTYVNNLFMVVQMSVSW